MMRTRPIRWLAAPAVAAVFVLGVWVTGGLITHSFKAAMALTAAWFALSGAACLTIAVKERPLRLPVLGAYALSAAAVGGFLAWTTLRDRVVHERLPVGIELTGGTFESIEHASSGRAAI